MSADLCLGRMTWANRTGLGGLGKFALVEPARGHHRLRRWRAPAAGSRAPAGCRPGNAARRDPSGRAQDAAAERGAEIARSDPKRGAAQSRWCRRQNPPSQAACGSQGRATKPSGHARQRSLPPANGGSAVGHTRRGRISMRRSAKRLSLPVTLLAAGLLAAGCGGTISSSGGSLPSRTATAPARPSVTAAPTTQQPGHTVTVTSAPTAPTAGSAAPAASSGTSLLWLWVLLGVLVLAGLIALIARSARRRSAAAADWRSRLVEAYAKGSALHDAMSVAEAPGGLAAADAAARWSDIQRRADDLAQTLYTLREAVPQDSADRARIADTLASLQAVRSAMDAERAPGGASLEQAEVVRSRLASFESSLRALGTPDR